MTNHTINTPPMHDTTYKGTNNSYQRPSYEDREEMREKQVMNSLSRLLMGLLFALALLWIVFSIIHSTAYNGAAPVYDTHSNSISSDTTTHNGTVYNGSPTHVDGAGVAPQPAPPTQPYAPNTQP